MNADAPSILPDDTLIGRNRIRRFLWPTSLGPLYEITIGSTTHEYGLLVLDPASRPASADALHDALKPVLAATDPCLAKPFACGENDGRMWIRMELTESVRFSLFQSEHRHGGHGRNDDGDDIRIEDAQELLDAFGGTLPQPVFNAVLGDLVEGLAAVHKAGGTLGPLTLRDIGFEEWIRSAGPHYIAKWCNYGLLPLQDPGRAASWSQQDDIQMLAGLCQALLPGGGAAATAWPEWREFLAKAGVPGGFADADALADAYQAVLAAHRETRPPRIRPEDTIAPRTSNSFADESPRHQNPQPSGHSHRHSRRPSSGGNSNRTMLFVAIAAGIGIVTLLVRPKLVSGIIDSVRGIHRPSSTPPSAVPVATNSVASASADVWGLSFDELKAANEDGANLPARMRYAFALAEGGDGRDPDPELAGAVAAETYLAMGDRPAGADPALDRACEFWRGYALLAGLGVEADPASALLLLERAEEIHGDLRAKSLLADYYASGAEDGHTPRNDDEALSRWLDIVEQESGASRLSPEAERCADKIAAFFFAGRAIPDREQDRYIARIENIARHRHMPTILALGRIYLDGKLANLDEGTAKKWYSDAAQSGNAEGMYHMAWMLERGIASAPSDRAATIWYRRAASAGSAEAMRALARLLRTQRIKSESGEPLDVEGGKTADEWDAAAQSDAVPPATLPYTTWWLGAQGRRFPDPEPVRAM